MHKTRITLPLFYLLTLCAPLFAAEPVAFVEQGKPVNVIQQPGPWKATGDGLVGEKMGQFLFGNVKLLEGDITVRLNMSIEQFDGTAAGLVLDGDNYIGFDSRNGSIFVQGPRFPSDSSIKIGNRDDLLRPGEPFEFVLERTNGTLNLYIDGKLLRQFDDPAKQFGTVGVRTHRAKIAVYNFSAEGNVEPLPDGFAFDRPSVAFVKPDLTSLKPVPGVETVVVFDSEVDGYNTYRIPAVIKTQAGTLLAFCEGRKNSRSDTGDIDLLVKRSDDDGRTWSTHTVIWDDGENTCGNPCPVIDRNTGDIILTMTRNPGSNMSVRYRPAPPRQAGPSGSAAAPMTQTGSEPSSISEQTKAPDCRWYATGPAPASSRTANTRAGSSSRAITPSPSRSGTDRKNHQRFARDLQRRRRMAPGPTAR
ncbi:MAG: sialidase family protein [Phycisphaerales bacterium]